VNEVSPKKVFIVFKEAQPGMNIPLKITFRNMPPSKAIEDNVREKAAKLDSFSDRIMSCRVIVEAPHRHHHKGKAYEVRIDLTVPGAELVINRAPKRLAAAKLELASDEKALAESHEPSKHAAHEDVYVAIRDAFNAAGRKLQDYARRHSGAVKVHDGGPPARVTKLIPEKRYVFLRPPMGEKFTFMAIASYSLVLIASRWAPRCISRRSSARRGPRQARCDSPADSVRRQRDLTCSVGYCLDGSSSAARLARAWRSNRTRSATWVD
jgi:ribosome-associated translation inhibitor RaiA